MGFFEDQFYRDESDGVVSRPTQESTYMVSVNPICYDQTIFPVVATSKEEAITKIKLQLRTQELKLKVTWEVDTI